ncbi:SLC13 family permease [Gudongella sp. SC589]|jgi:di/tricarboxylate transporter|uniref:SLC13 family permease n=1 Tax=Gudongella sp. SC589 TaxID=3385990 RepID=UPI003904D079
MFDQIVVFSVIVVILVLFIDGRIRYDFVSLGGLVALSIAGVVKPEESFSGFSHPAIITVAAVLVISSGLVKTGVIDHIVSALNRRSKSSAVVMTKLMMITALLSGFMNNIGALALVLPVAIKVAREHKFSPSRILMPLAFSALLGGMTTEIGTPPNLIISSYRQEHGLEAFGFFDFTPVGLTVTILGVGLMVLLGGRLIPKRKTIGVEKLFNIGEFLSEVQVVDSSKLAGKPMMDMNRIHKLDIDVLSIIRNDQKIVAPGPDEILVSGDILIIKALSQDLADLIDKTNVLLKGTKKTLQVEESMIKSRDTALVEVVLRDDSPIIGRTALETKLRNRYSINLVAVSRKGVYSVDRLKSIRFRTGDILLIQAPTSILKDIYSKLGCLPLAERGFEIYPDRTKWKLYFTAGIFALSVVLTTTGLLPVQTAFAFAATALVLFRILTPREFYDAIEWPSIIMLGSLIPLGGALQSSGGADTIANILLRASTILTPTLMIGLLMILTIALANLISTSATAILMGPIALSISMTTGVSPDPYLMSVSVAASAAFLTPIGHQTNMLVMGPGGYKFTDYWHLGLPLTILLVTVGAPLILLVWPM